MVDEVAQGEEAADGAATATEDGLAAPLAPAPEPPPYQPGDEIILRGKPACWNYTFGPAYVYKGPRSIDEIYHMGEPVIVVCDRIPMDELRKIELSRVRGFVFEEGSSQDEELFNFLVTEKRASVLSCPAASYFAREGGWVIVDGVQGLVCFNPTGATLQRFEEVRKEGPPERERMDAVVGMLDQMVQDAAEKREQDKEEGTYVDPHDHHVTPKEAVQMQKEAPGLILQVLAGLPIKGAPGAEEAGYKEGGAGAAGAGPEPGGAPEEAADAEDGAEPEEEDGDTRRRQRAQSGGSRRSRGGDADEG